MIRDQNQRDREAAAYKKGFDEGYLEAKMELMPIFFSKPHGFVFKHRQELITQTDGVETTDNWYDGLTLEPGKNGIDEVSNG